MEGGEKYKQAHSGVQALNRLRQAGTRKRKHEKISHFNRDRKRARALWNDPNILGYGVGPKVSKGGKTDFCLVFFVRKKMALERLRHLTKIPERLLIETLGLEVQTDVQEWGRPPVAHLNPGSEIGDSFGHKGTMTAAVRNRDTGAPLILSCSHVLAQGGEGAHEGDLIESPVFPLANLGVNVVGTLFNFVNLRRHANNSLDGATATPSAGIPASNNIPGIAAIAAIRDLRQENADDINGLSLRKVGATSGTLAGTLGNMHISIPLVYHEMDGDPVLDFVELVEITCESEPGDSGAAIIDDNNRLVGMNIGGNESGSGLFTHIQPVFDLLKLTF
jgi:hypothetical protein